MSGSVNIHTLALKEPAQLTVASGVITVTQQLNVITSETSTTDDVDTITLGFATLSIDAIEYYPLIYLRAASGHTITLVHGVAGADNLDLPSDTSIAVPDDAWVALLYDGTFWTAFKATGL